MKSMLTHNIFEYSSYKTQNILKFTNETGDSVTSQYVIVAYALTVVFKIGIATRNVAVVSNESR